MGEEEIIFKVKIDVGETEKGIKELKTSLDLLKAANVENTTAIKNQEEAIKKSQQAIKAEEGSIKALRESSKALRAERDLISTSTAEGRKRIEDLNKSIQENDKRIKENSTNLEKQRLNVGNYTDSIKDAAGQLNIAGVNVGEFSGALTDGIDIQKAAALSVGAVGAAVGLLASLYVSSAAGARDLSSAQTQLSTTFKLIGNDLAKLVGADGKGGGLLSALAFEVNRSLFGIDNAVAGQIAANSQRALEELEILKLEADRFAKDQLNLAEQNRQIRDNDTKSFEERFAAAQAVEDAINDREARRLEVENRRLDAMKVLLALDEQNLELQAQVKQIEFEIADIQEEAQGQRTEALNGIIGLQKEMRQNAIDENGKIVESTLEAQLTIKEAKDEDFQKDLARINSRTQAEIDASNLTVDVTKLEIDETELLKDEAARRDAERIAQNTKNEQIAGDQRIQTAKTVFGSIGQIMSAFGVKSKGLNSALALANTFLGVTEILKAPTAPFIEPFASVVRAAQIATTLATGLGAVKQINSVSAAAGGGDFVTTKPTLLLVGDNPGAIERVTVTPLSGKGKTTVSRDSGLIAMAGGGSITTGGFETAQVANQIESQRGFRQVVDAFAQMKVVLPIQDFEKVQNEKNQIEATATVFS